jgi:NADPH-dependent 2,4-dienoyl-CoA reductase/sulfur reductase-like enzyme
MPLSILIIGGSDAGISAALRAHELDASAGVVVVLADAFPNFSICGLPFFLSGETPDWKHLAHRTEFPGIEILTNNLATSIDPKNKTIWTKDKEGHAKLLNYDKLIIGTGATPVRPPINGLDSPGVYVLHTMDDSFLVHDRLNKNPKSAVIVGAGYIGLEMADALVHRGLEVTLISRPNEVLSTVDRELGQLVRKELDRKGVRVFCGREIQSINELPDGKLDVSDSKGFKVSADFVLVGVGVRPASELAESAGIKIGDLGAIRVNRAMETSVADIYAAGDCVETWHRLLNRSAFLPLGTTSHKQGRVAGENAVGGNAQFAGSLGTQVVKVFELVIARTGIRDEEARKAGFDPLTVQSSFWDHKAYYPGAQEIVFRICGDKSTGRLLGAQMIGHWKSEISKRIDIFATALFHNMTVESLNELDLSYTPPLSSPWDPVQMAAQAWCLRSRDRQRD